MNLDLPVPTATVPSVVRPRRQEIASFGDMDLEVTALCRSPAFWYQVIVLHIRSEDPDTVQLGTLGHTLVTLLTGAQHGFLPRHSGLYHLAIHPPSQVEF